MSRGLVVTPLCRFGSSDPVRCTLAAIARATFARATLAVMLAATSLAGCNFLPQAGPKYATLTERPTPGAVATVDFELVRINGIVAEETRIDTSRALGQAFTTAPEIDLERLRRGDVVSVYIWEPVAGLFPSSAGSVAGKENLQKLSIDARGELYVPFVGTIKAEGLEVRQLRERIQRQLATQTPGPQVLVTLDASRERSVTIQGDVKTSGRFPLQQGTTRLLPLLAEAGGPTGHPEITELALRRGEEEGVAWLDEVYREPAYNVALAPGDLVLVRRTPLSFNALGQVKKTGRVFADRRDVSLLRALSLVGSLDDLRADATGVFLFRVEQLGVIERLAQNNQLDSAHEDRIPAQQFVYLLDFSEGNSLFFADRFQVRDGDTLYVTNAPADDWRKLLSVVLPTLSLPQAGASATAPTAVVGTP